MAAAIFAMHRTMAADLVMHMEGRASDVDLTVPTSANVEARPQKPALVPNKASDELVRSRAHDAPPMRSSPLTPSKPAALIAPAVTVAKPAPLVAPAQKPATRATQPSEPSSPTPKAAATPRKPVLTNRPAGSIVRETPF